MDVTVEFTGGCTDARTAAPTTGVLPYYYGARSYYYGAPYYYGIPTMLLLWAVVLMVRWRLSIDRHEGGLLHHRTAAPRVTRCCGMTANAG